MSITRHTPAPRTTSSAGQRLADVVTELVDATTTVTACDDFESRPAAGGLRWRRTRRRHVVRHPCLLDQLAAAVQSGTLGAQDSYRPTPGSRPSARLDALAALERVDVESRRWAQVLGARVRVPLRDRLRALVLLADAGEQTRDARGRTLLQAACSWRAVARVVTGWDCPPYSPPVPCPDPQCERLGSLRVRFDSGHLGEQRCTAVCLECGATWEPDQVHALAEYVRWAGEHLRGPEHLVVAEGVEELVRCAECEGVRAAMAARRQARMAHVTLQPERPWVGA